MPVIHIGKRFYHGAERPVRLLQGAAVEDGELPF